MIPKGEIHTQNELMTNEQKRNNCVLAVSEFLGTCWLCICIQFHYGCSTLHRPLVRSGASFAETYFSGYKIKIL